MDIDLQVGRLVLEGFTLTSEEAAVVRAEAETELVRRLAVEPGEFANVLQGFIPLLRAPTLELDAGTRPAALGRQIASATAGGMRRG